MKHNDKNILLVEDDVNFGAILNDFLKLHSYNVTLAKNCIEGLEKFKKNDFGLCILDVMILIIVVCCLGVCTGFQRLRCCNLHSGCSYCRKKKNI